MCVYILYRIYSLSLFIYISAPLWLQSHGPMTVACSNPFCSPYEMENRHSVRSITPAALGCMVYTSSLYVQLDRRQRRRERHLDSNMWKHLLNKNTTENTRKCILYLSPVWYSYLWITFVSKKLLVDLL